MVFSLPTPSVGPRLSTLSVLTPLIFETSEADIVILTVQMHMLCLRSHKKITQSPTSKLKLHYFQILL